MFEVAIKQYISIVQGNKAYVSIIFHAFTGILIGLFLFILFNLGYNQEITLYNFKIGVNNQHFLLMSPERFLMTTPLKVEYKGLEFLLLFAFSITVTSLVELLIKRAALRDALSPIRKQMLGKWQLDLSDFAVSGNSDRVFSCKVWFDSTEAQKLRAFYYDSSEMEVDGNTALVALYVAEGRSGPEQVDIAFPIAAEINVSGRPPFTILYWIRLNYTALRVNKNGIVFRGQWYSIANAGAEYNASGSADLKFVSRVR